MFKTGPTALILLFALLPWSDLRAMAPGGPQLPSKVIQIKIKSAESAPLKIKAYLRPELIVLNNTDWTLKSIQTQVDQTSKIYKQCELYLDQARVTLLDHPYGPPTLHGPFSKLKDPGDDREDQLVIYVRKLLKLNPTAPLVFFMGEIFKSRENPGGILAYAYPDYYMEDKKRPSLHTVWMASRYIYWDGTFGDFVKSSLDGVRLAHELGHVLGNFKHDEDDANLMASGPEHSLLRSQQCQKLLKSPLVVRLK